MKSQEPPVTVYQAWGLTQAHFVRQLLLNEGIQARIASHAVESVAGEVPSQLATCPIWVSAEDAPRAQEIVDQYDRRLGWKSTKPTPAKPFCYHCGASVQRGQSPCPVCGSELDWRDEIVA